MAQIQAGVYTTDSSGFSVTPDAAAHTKGSWVEIIPSTSFDAKVITVMVHSPFGAAGRDALFDIGTGSAGNETPIINNLIASTGSVRCGYWYPFPIGIASGTRISARVQGSAASTGLCGVSVYMVGETNPKTPSFSTAITLGADTSDTSGVTIDPGGSANTKGAWVQMTGSLPAPCHYWSIGIGNRANTDRLAAGWLIDVGLWDGDSYEVIIPDIQVNTTAGGDVISNPGVMLYPYSVDTGGDIAIRAACSITDATDRLLDAILYGTSGYL